MKVANLYQTEKIFNVLINNESLIDIRWNYIPYLLHQNIKIKQIMID